MCRRKLGFLVAAVTLAIIATSYVAAEDPYGFCGPGGFVYDQYGWQEGDEPEVPKPPHSQPRWRWRHPGSAFGSGEYVEVDGGCGTPAGCSGGSVAISLVLELDGEEVAGNTVFVGGTYQADVILGVALPTSCDNVDGDVRIITPDGVAHLIATDVAQFGNGAGELLVPGVSYTVTPEDDPAVWQVHYGATLQFPDAESGDIVGCIEDSQSAMSGWSYTAITQSSCADVDGDGSDGTVLDIMAVIQAWGTDDLAADVNASGEVDVLDLIAVVCGHCPG